MTSQVARKDGDGKKKEGQVQKKTTQKNMSEIDEHILRRFEIKKRLGKGAYGIVWKAIDRKSKEVVAIKKIFDAFRNQTDAQRTFREILFLQSFRNHPNIVKLHSIHRASNNKDIYLGFEYMETDLHNVIKRGNILKDVHKRYIMYQMLKATKYIHSGNVIHRDQKPSNVLIDSACRIKIADFGLARSISNLNGGNEDGADPCLTDYVATRWYRAPEILIASKRYTKGIDMWSLGCILGEMLLGKPLFPGSSTVNQIERIMSALPRPSGEDIAAVCTGYGSSLIKEGASAAGGGRSLVAQLNNVPRDAADLVQRLLVFNPAHRLSAEDALLHDYVARFHRDKDEPVLSTDVVLPFRDDRQLSVDDYRNKLYSLMAKGMHAAGENRKIHTSKTSSHLNSSVCKAHGDTLEHTTHLRHKTRSATKQTSAVDPKMKLGVINRNNVAVEKCNNSVDITHLTNTQSESKITGTATKCVTCTPENTKSEHQIYNNRKQITNRERKSLDSKLPSGRVESMVESKRRASVDGWLMYQEKSSAQGDFFQPVTRHSHNENGYLSGGYGKKKTSLLMKGKRNNSSYSTISITNAGEMMGPNFSNFNQKHGIITASALMDLRSSIR